jgi:capsular exopolysaccharide synthesis family protein
MRAQDQIIMRDQRGAMAPLQPMLPTLGAQPPVDHAEPSLIKAVLRHWWLVIVFATVGGAAATAYLAKAQRFYTAEEQIYIQPSGPAVLSESLASAERSNYLYTQAEMIMSTPILQQVADKPEMKGLRTWDMADGNAVYYMRNAIDAEVGRKDDLITVSIPSPYADESAKIVAAVVDAYIDYQNSEKKTNTSARLDALEKSKESTDKELDGLKDQMLQFQQSNPTLNIETVFQSDLSTLSSEYTRAQLATIEAKATYLPGHPVLLKAEAKEQALYDQYDQKLQEVLKLNVQAAQYAKITADLQQKQEFAKILDDRIKVLEVARNADQIINDVEIIEPAAAPDYPSFPKPKRTLAAATVAGALLGIGLALIRDRRDGRMHSVEEIQVVIGLPILGVVPAMTGRRTAVARAMTVHLDPRSVVAESYRTIRTAVYFGTTGARAKTLLMTSPEPGDGKTTSASNLAIAIAQTGRSVLLLDADFRKPTQHKNLDVKDSVGLSSVLAGRETLERAIQHTGVEGLDILPCGPIPANPSEILNSREFGELIDSLAMRYDHIIFDSPPVNAVTDARILGAVCDATILVLRADKSTRKSGEHARNSLLTVGAKILGAIVNDAPNRKGYEVYGGSYYGNVDSGKRQDDTRGKSGGRKRLASPSSDIAD